MIRRGDLITAVLPREYGKPRPAVVVQSDRFREHSSVIVCPITTELRDAPYVRLAIEPSPANGLEHMSQLMVDKLSPIDRSRIGKIIGRAEPEIMERLGMAISAFLDLA